MSTKDSSKTFLTGTVHQRVQIALDRLLAELEPCHGSDRALHQLWLEIQWLAANAAAGVLTLPRWELILFQMVNRPPLSRLHPANQAAIAAVQVLREATGHEAAS